jgi:thiamine transporter
VTSGLQKVSVRVRKLTYFALTLALVIVLGSVKVSVFWAVGGGSVTLFSMVPIVCGSVKYGSRFGVLLGICCGLFKLQVGFGRLVAFGAMRFWLSVLLDYLLSYGAIGLAGAFMNTGIRNLRARLSFCVLNVFSLRFLAHTLSGVLVWKSLLMGANNSGKIFVASACYNLSYLVPEMLLTILGTQVIVFYANAFGGGSKQKL